MQIIERQTLLIPSMMHDRTRDNQRFDQIGSGDRVYAVGSAPHGFGRHFKRTRVGVGRSKCLGRTVLWMIVVCNLKDVSYLASTATTSSSEDMSHPRKQGALPKRYSFLLLPLAARAL
jgi:hypothetical protein